MAEPGGCGWSRADTKRYRSRETCQRRADWLNRQFDDDLRCWWHEPVIAPDGESWELWRCPRDDAFEGDDAAP